LEKNKCNFFSLLPFPFPPLLTQFSLRRQLHSLLWNK
jgi:hypothetical protein